MRQDRRDDRIEDRRAPECVARSEMSRGRGARGEDAEGARPVAGETVTGRVAIALGRRGNSVRRRIVRPDSARRTRIVVRGVEVQQGVERGARRARSQTDAGDEAPRPGAEEPKHQPKTINFNF